MDGPPGQAVGESCGDKGCTAEVGPAAQALLDLSRPDIDFIALATGLGVPATRARGTAELAEQFSAASAEPGPHPIEAMLQFT
ncbi:hypothetical protein ACWCWD_25360 [Streptomyces sp. NPDC001493]